MLNQIKVGEGYPKLKPIYQININNFDVFNSNKFIYRSVIMEESLHKKRNDFITIIDINIEFLGKIDYNKIMEEESDSLERMLYIFVCNNKEFLDKLYLGNEIMEKVREKLSALTEDFAEGLYYDRDEYINKCSYEKGVEQTKMEMAKAMKLDKISIESIIKYTGLTKEQIDLL